MVHRATYATSDNHKVNTLTFNEMSELGYLLVSDGHGCLPHLFAITLPTPPRSILGTLHHGEVNP